MCSFRQHILRKPVFCNALDFLWILMSYCATGVDVKLSEYYVVAKLSTAWVFIEVTDSPGTIHILRTYHDSQLQI